MIILSPNYFRNMYQAVTNAPNPKNLSIFKNYFKNILRSLRNDSKIDANVADILLQNGFETKLEIEHSFNLFNKRIIKQTKQLFDKTDDAYYIVGEFRNNIFITTVDGLSLRDVITQIWLHSTMNKDDVVDLMHNLNPTDYTGLKLYLNSYGIHFNNNNFVIPAGKKTPLYKHCSLKKVKRLINQYFACPAY